MIKPAIVAVGYNRPQCMKRLLDSIGQAVFDDSDIPLIVSIDESDRSDEVQKVAEDFQWQYGEKIIRRFPERQGLRSHIIQCGDLSDKYGAVIILEDDLYVSPGFYTYVQQAQEFYFQEERVAGVSLYSNGVNVFCHDRFVPEKNRFDTYFGQYIITWGESWTAKQWHRYKEWYIKHENCLPAVNNNMPSEILRWTRSWGKYFISYMVDQDLFYIMPYTALSTNFSEKGEHRTNVGYETAYQVPLLMDCQHYSFPSFDEGVKYDSFFERRIGSEIEPGILGNDICFDLYGTRCTALNHHYLLSMKKYDFPVIKTYGLRMRPMETNVLRKVDGDGIYLYKIEPNIKLNNGVNAKNSSELTIDRIRYEMQGLRRKQITHYLKYLYKDLFLRKIRGVFSRRK